MRIAVYCSARNEIAQVCHEDARKLGLWIGSHGHTLVYGGLTNGLMGVVASAVAESGGKVMGVVPESRAHNQHPDNTVSIAVCSLHERKQVMEENADAFVALDGGYGTLDEVMSALATMSFFNETKPLMMLNRENLYTPLQQMMQQMVDRHLMSPQVFNHISFCPTIEDLISKLEEC